jgi:hypothetical protein
MQDKGELLPGLQNINMDYYVTTIFHRVRPTYSWFLLITTCGRLSLGLASAFVCHLRVRLVYGLALLPLTVPLPLLDCPTSGLWPRSAVGPLVAASAQFVFPPVPGAPPRPHLPRMLPNRPPRPLDWVSIWSMKELCNLNYDDRNVFEEFFHWPDASNEN